MILNIIVIAIIFLPLFASAVVGFSTSRIKPLYAQLITSGAVVISALLSWVMFYIIHTEKQIVHLVLAPWFDVQGLSANWAIYVDVLTAVMLVVVNTVSALVHVYSVGYMSSDPHKQRFMSYLSLFTFFMLVLVVSDNFAQLFVGWEGVGLSSYLLIGFWFKKKAATSAAIKAFLVNRVGDIGLALGIFTIAITFSSLDFIPIFANAHQMAGEKIRIMGMEIEALTLACALLFIGCMGKSAQIGLHTWLPDAMEGPTPVSALIHAATMVTAGVFLVARCSPIFEYAPCVLWIITIVGAVTALFAATVALVQDDIKKIIAYSTCSQLGYMFFACGVSAYSAGVFHLMTHAFFKALLFLGAGSVIHALSDEQDIKKMGGIWKKLPYTHAFMLIGSLALAGIPPLAGFFSKDMLLEAAFGSGSVQGVFAYWVGIIVAILTAFYSWRLLILTFYGPTKLPQDVMKHAHEAPSNMLISLSILAIGAVFSGIIGMHYLGIVDPDGAFWHNAIFVLEHHNSLERAHHAPVWVAQMPTLAAVAGISLAYIIYYFWPSISQILYSKFSLLRHPLSHKWYFDAVYNVIFVSTSGYIGNILWQNIDVQCVDGIPKGAARLVGKFSRIVSLMQTGHMYHYATAMIIGIVALLYWYLPWQ